VPYVRKIILIYGFPHLAALFDMKNHTKPDIGLGPRKIDHNKWLIHPISLAAQKIASDFAGYWSQIASKSDLSPK